MSFTLYRPICHLKWQERILSLNLFNPMQTIIRYKAPNFMNCIKLVHKALSVRKTNSISHPPPLPTHIPPHPPHTQPSLHSVLLSTSHVYAGTWLGLCPTACQPTSLVLTLGWNCNHSQSGKRTIVDSRNLDIKNKNKLCYWVHRTH